jgi:ribosomal protein S3
VFAERVESKNLSPDIQAEAVKGNILKLLPLRRCAYTVLRSAIEDGAKGAEVVVSGKIRGQRAKAMKFRQGYMIKSGESSRDYTVEAVRHVLLKQGILGVVVRIMLPIDPASGRKPLADVVTVHAPKEDPLAIPKLPLQPERGAAAAHHHRGGDAGAARPPAPHH